MTATDETSQVTASADWWERLYAEAETVAAEPVSPPRAAGRIRGRLPEWWAEKPEDLSDVDADAVSDADVDADVGSDQDGTDGDGGESDRDEDQDGGDGGRGGKWFRPKSGYYPRPPRPSAPARPALSEGTKRLLYNVSAAGVGYFYGPTRMVGGWIESCGRETSIGGALVLGGGICLLTAHFWDRRTRHWMPGLAWVARIPLASALTALALYAPASQI